MAEKPISSIGIHSSDGSDTQRKAPNVESTSGAFGIVNAGSSGRKRARNDKCGLCLFFDERFPVRRLVCGDDFFGQFVRHVVVMRVFHGVAGAALGHGR